MFDDFTLSRLTSLLDGRRFVALTGAGCSTESGIPDYRGPETQRRARNPIRWAAYMADPQARRRYWARSLVGWPRMARAAPNPAHHAMAALEQTGTLRGIITQNVDRLHTRAGNQHVVELHGALAEVCCLDCRMLEPRDRLQERLLALNPTMRRADTERVESAPDGDAELDDERLAAFVIADCQFCGGTLKPDVVFFGESVPRIKVEKAMAWLDEAEVLLVVGSSLAVYSGYRFVLRAAERKIPVAIVNLGATRGDPLAHVKLDQRAGEVLPRLLQRLTGRSLEEAI